MSLDDNNSSISSISDNSYNNNNNNNNGGMVDAHRDLFLLYEQNHSIHQPWFTLFSLAYGILILLTFAGNSLVVFAVVRKKEMWSARNILILNLALSGLSKAASWPFHLLRIFFLDLGGEEKALRLLFPPISLFLIFPSFFSSSYSSLCNDGFDSHGCFEQVLAFWGVLPYAVSLRQIFTLLCRLPLFLYDCYHSSWSLQIHRTILQTTVVYSSGMKEIHMPWRIQTELKSLSIIFLS